MEADFLWTYAPALKLKLLVAILLGQVVLTLWIYTQMAKARFAAVKEGKATREDYTVIRQEPEASLIVARTLQNQFELPVLFYIIVITGIAVNVSSWLTVVLALVFVILRVSHAREMLGENRVMKRRAKFINTIRIFMLMVVELLVSTLLFLQA